MWQCNSRKVTLQIHSQWWSTVNGTTEERRISEMIFGICCNLVFILFHWARVNTSNFLSLSTIFAINYSSKVLMILMNVYTILILRESINVMRVRFTIRWESLNEHRYHWRQRWQCHIVNIKLIIFIEGLTILHVPVFRVFSNATLLISGRYRLNASISSAKETTFTIIIDFGMLQQFFVCLW